MRGVVGAGMVAALESRGLLNAFDTIHGSSVGACTAAYFLAGQARFGASIYYEDIRTKKIINPLRPLLGRPIFDKDYLIDTVMRLHKPLDVSSIIDAPGVLHIITTDIDSGSARIFNTYRDADHLFQVLKASICMPVLGGWAVEVNDMKLVDGGLVQHIPLASALQAGATHVLVLMSRRPEDLHRHSRIGLLKLPGYLLKLTHGPVIAELYERQDDQINADVASIVSGHASNGAVLASIMRSNRSRKIGLLTSGRVALLGASADARRAAEIYLDTGETQSKIEFTDRAG
jgi:predicted patatin/cPLA2 family phospholipase